MEVGSKIRKRKSISKREMKPAIRQMSIGSYTESDYAFTEQRPALETNGEQSSSSESTIRDSHLDMVVEEQ